MAAEFEHVKFCTVMHVLQRLENWRSSSENTTGDDLIHCLCVRESFERSLEVAVMSYSGENHRSNYRMQGHFGPLVLHVSKSFQERSITQ